LASESLKIGQEIQQIMKKIVEGNFDPDQCKIRVINYENYIVGLEENDENFIHISIKILAGRAVEVRQKLALQSFEFVNNFYKNLKLSQKRCDISIDIIEMNRETYQKITLKK
jgi:5-carboxymethyl-2-hydroxymuconate isomerase